MKRKDQDIRRKKKTQWEANGLKRGDSSVMGVPDEVKKEKRKLRLPNRMEEGLRKSIWPRSPAERWEWFAGVF